MAKTKEKESTQTQQRRRRLVLVTMLPLLVLATAVQAADPVTTSRFYSIAGAPLFVCIPGNPLVPPSPIEPVALSGMIHVVTRVTFVSPALETVLIHANLANVSGTGSISGLTYHAVGSAKQFTNGPPIVPIPFSGTYDFIQQGPCPPSHVTVNGTVQINPDGTQGPGTTFTFGTPTF